MIYPFIKRIVFALLFLSLINHTKGQNVNKLPLDTSDFNQWPYVNTPQISNNGEYIGFRINAADLYLKSTTKKWKKTFTDIESYSFLNDNKSVIILNRHDSLYLLTLGTDKLTIIPHVISYSTLLPKWLVYLRKHHETDLVIQQLNNKKEITFRNVTSYLTGSQGNMLMLKRRSENGESLYLLDMQTLQEDSICHHQQFESITIDETNRQVAFIADSVLWRYKPGDKAPSAIVTPEHSGIIENIEKFSADGNLLFFSMKDCPPERSQDNTVQPDIWSGADKRLQSEQLKEVAPKSNICAINLNTNKTFHLQRPDEYFRFLNEHTGLVTHLEANNSERNWNAAAKEKYIIVDLSTGHRTDLPFEARKISPDGKFIVGYDKDRTNYLSYNINTGSTKNLTQSIPIQQTNVSYDLPGIVPCEFIFGGWLSSDSSLILYDNFDIWKVDPKGDETAVCLTNHYGRKNHLIFKLATEYNNDFITDKGTLLLNAFNTSTKENGFYSINQRKPSTPVKLTMDDCVYNQPYTNLPGFYPLKALNANKWIVKKESADSSPNYYVTENFITFKPLSELHPEKNVNWFTTTLINFRTINGIHSQGILYKPDNFDASRKYPVIIHYYEKLSDHLNVYKEPAPAHDNINIPWMVSHGYLVFTPDIYYTIGQPGQSALNTILGAFNHLSRYPWVDTTKIGLQGHSFGGYETCFIISHTDKFAAAVSAAGITDFVSDYGGIRGDAGNSLKGQYELTIGRIGKTLWEDRNLYIDNSPVFFADKINTPLLMMHNKEDGAVSFSQGVELFTALRRLSKTVWMLQYDGEGHSILDNRASIDYTLRMEQFFDHYLKNKPCPGWMLPGVNATDKGR